MFVVAFFFIFLISTPICGKEREVEVNGVICSFPKEIGQGDVFLVKVKPKEGEEIKSIKGKFLGRELRFFKVEGEYRCLIFAGLFDEPGESLLHIEFQGREGVGHLGEKVKVVKRHFGVERLNLPQSKVTLSKETLARVRREKEMLDRIWEEETKERYWRGRFLLPVKGCIGSKFGMRRIINGQPRSPHTGVDIKAKHGAEVLSANHGKVKFIGDLFFSGTSLIIDHGGGLYTMYFHLSKILVKVGEKVRRGQPVACVGATGRATGPHLHFGVRLQGARVNPHSLFSLPEE